MQFHPTQSIVAKDNTQFRVVCCGRQWGKTELAIWEMLACAVARKGRRVGYFATTHAQAKDIAWRRLKEISEPAWAKEPNETLLELWVNTADGGQSEIVLRSWESVSKSRGTQFDFIVLDEVSKMRNFIEGWEGDLSGTLAFRNGKALLISTPAGFNHFEKLYQLGQGQSPNYKSWRFTSFDNPYLSRDYLKMKQSESTTDYWAQEYLADFRRFTGLVYKEFDINTHVHEFDHTLNEHGEYLFGQDFAVRGWNAAVNIKIKETGDIYILDNYKENGLTSDVHSKAIKEMLTKYADLGKYTGYADPAGWISSQEAPNPFTKEMFWSLANEYIEDGLPILRANNEVTAGIDYVRKLFKANKIHIHPRCTQLIEELLQYQWKPQTETNVEQDEPEKVRKINDHLVDALRYVLYSKASPPDAVKPKPTSPTAIVFPPPTITVNQDEDKLTIINNPSLFDI